MPTTQIILTFGYSRVFVSLSFFPRYLFITIKTNYGLVSTGTDLGLKLTVFEIEHDIDFYDFSNRKSLGRGSC